MTEINMGMLADFSRMAFKGEMDKLRKKLEERGFEFTFYPDAPMTLLVTQDNAQMEMDEDENEMQIVLYMHLWGDVRYRFQCCEKMDVPEDLLRLCKAGFRKIAGAYLMMQHYLEIQARAAAIQEGQE